MLFGVRPYFPPVKDMGPAALPKAPCPAPKLWELPIHPALRSVRTQLFAKRAGFRERARCS